MQHTPRCTLHTELLRLLKDPAATQIELQGDMLFSTDLFPPENAHNKAKGLNISHEVCNAACSGGSLPGTLWLRGAATAGSWHAHAQLWGAYRLTPTAAAAVAHAPNPPTTHEQVSIRACRSPSAPVVVDVNNLLQQVYVYGRMSWQGSIRFINSFPSPRRAGLFPLISILSVERDGVIEFKVRRQHQHLRGSRGQRGGVDVAALGALAVCDVLTACCVMLCCAVQGVHIHGNEPSPLFDTSDAFWSVYQNDSAFVPQPSDYERVAPNALILSNWTFNKTPWVLRSQVCERAAVGCLGRVVVASRTLIHLCPNLFAAWLWLSSGRSRRRGCFGHREVALDRRAGDLGAGQQRSWKRAAGRHVPGPRNRAASRAGHGAAGGHWGAAVAPAQQAPAQQAQVRARVLQRCVMHEPRSR
jgi:hypothetical protein